MLQNGKHHFYWFTAILFATLFLTAQGFSQGNTPVTSPKRDSLHTPATSALTPAPTPATTPIPALTTTPPPPKPDTTHPAPVVYHYDSPTPDPHDCPLGVETSSECWRREKNLANMTAGYPGIRALTLSTTNWQPLPISSPYFPAWQHSQYLNSTLGPVEKYGLKSSGSDIQGLEEIWMPVIPIDTPTTRLDWERGPFAMNIFNLKLRRMLSDHVYLGMDYYSATADSFTYDYQFNVHQPYLGGWGFLGQIYHPIDRDSASLVIEGLSHQIKSTAIRPRVGVWLDTNRVLEFYLNYLKNSTTLTFPQGPATFNSLARPGAVDSMQALMPARFVSTTDGVLYGEHHNRWSWQGEGSYTSLSKAEIRPSDSAIAQAASPTAAPTSSPLTIDQLSANIFTLSTTFNGQKIPLQPTLTFLTQSETWSSDSVHTTLSPNKNGLFATSAWTDKEEFNLAIHPEFGNLNLSANAGFNRSSRMDDQVFFLERHGVSAQLQLPFHTRAEIGLAGQSQDPDWEILYRTNPARSLYANPTLQPRNDQTYQGSLDWSWSRFSLGAGVDFFRSTDAWLPRVLPSSTACQDLVDTIYSGVNSGVNTILCKAGADSAAHTLPDSMALALRNYDEEQLDGWHLTIGYGLGNWNLNLENHFLLNRTIKDGALKTDLEVWTVPARVFKGRLGWKRDLVDNKLHLDLAWEWEWFSTRYAWASDLRSNAKLEKLDEYLALDFKAAMRIKTFTLFFRSMNFNHDRYATEAGVHPPGVNFRFGVDWALSN